MDTPDAARVQNHYDSTANEYDRMHGNAQDPEHVVALDMFWRFVRPTIKAVSVLDVGCGTGRGLAWISERDEALTLSGVDPSKEMCARAAVRVPQAKISVGDGAKLDFCDSSFDIVIATGIMHHVGDSEAIIREMFRVARIAVLVSDHNDLAMGSYRSRRLRLALSTVGMLRWVNWLRQGFRHQRFSKEDGWFYPYSLLEDYDVFSELARETLILPTRIRGLPRGRNIILRQTHLAIVGLK